MRQTIIRVTQNGDFGVSFEKPMGDVIGATIFVEGFAEAALMFGGPDASYTIVIDVNSKQETR